MFLLTHRIKDSSILGGTSSGSRQRQRLDLQERFQTGVGRVAGVQDLKKIVGAFSEKRK